MERNKTDILNIIIQWGIFLAFNGLFVYKYVPRSGGNSILCTILYGILSTGLIWLYRAKIQILITERLACIFSILLTTCIIGITSCFIFLIDPYTIQVDRWSATTFFLDALRAGVYPYGVHTHISETNFPSPFPLWLYLNIPFWLIGDVGWMQEFALIVFLGGVWYYFRSWRILLHVAILFAISPAYWWELVVRSDGVSNMLIVCALILYIQRKPIEMENRWWLLALMAGCVASTRLSSVIPMALYLFKPWLDASWKQKIGFIGIAVFVVLIFFAPYIFWDTETWIFFQRNPFITQTLQGNTLVLGIMILIALAIADKKHSFHYYTSTTSAFIFIFILASQLYVLWTTREYTFSNSALDISYFTLAMPFTIISHVNPIR